MCHTVSAGVAAAFVMLLLAVGTHEADRTAAAVAARRIFLTGASVETRPVRASHRTAFTVLPWEALRARAEIVVHQILERKQETEREQTLPSRQVCWEFFLPVWFNKQRARMSSNSSVTHFAAAAVFAGVAVTLIGLSLAVYTSEPRLAGAGVTALSSVGARGIILARLVISAVV